MIVRASFTLVLLFFVGFPGCSVGPVEISSEEQEKHYQKGKSLLREGRDKEALSSFLKVIEKRDGAAESHLEAGRLYLNHIKDPVASIYHFRKYLEFMPDSRQTRLVRQLIETAKKAFARSLPGDPFADQIDRIDLLELIEEMKAENLDFKKELARMRQLMAKVGASRTGSSAPVARVPSVQVPPPPIPVFNSDPPVANDVATRPVSYAVQAGDTLTSISAVFYGTSDRWRDLFEANRNILENPHDLRVGQELKLP